MAVLPRAIQNWATAALQTAEYESLPDGRVFARVPSCIGAVATGANHSEAADHLLAVLEDWVILGIKLGDEIPVAGGIDLNQDEVRRLVQADES